MKPERFVEPNRHLGSQLADSRLHPGDAHGAHLLGLSFGREFET
jgi:hypothetical protein